MMINVTLATTAGKSLVTVEGNQTPSQVLEENSVATTGATVSLNMRPLADNEKVKLLKNQDASDGDP